MTGNAQGNAAKGVALVFLAVFMFALSDVATKHLVGKYDLMLIVAIRYCVNLILLVALLGPTGGKAIFATQRTWLVMLRGLCLALASLTMGFALQRMPVGEAVAIIYLSPLAVTLLAIPLLGERFSPAAFAGAVAGFAGVLLITRPGSGLDPVGVVFALLNAACATAYLMMSRLLARTEQTVAMLVHAAWIGTVFFSVFALSRSPLIFPSGMDLLITLALGVFATAGHFLFTAAYREAPASLLAPVNYLHIALAAGLGWIVFGHLPDAIAFAGMGLITLSGIAVAVRAHRMSNRQPALPAG